MTVTLDGKTLDVLHLGESADPVQVQWDAWENSAYKRKVKVYGLVRRWSLNCVEKEVAWASSQAKSFQESAGAGTTVTFQVTDQVRIVDTNVKILHVGLNVADLAGKNVRRFSLTLQEV